MEMEHYDGCLCLPWRCMRCVVPLSYFCHPERRYVLYFYTPQCNFNIQSHESRSLLKRTELNFCRWYNMRWMNGGYVCVCVCVSSSLLKMEFIIDNVHFGRNVSLCPSFLCDRRKCRRMKWSMKEINTFRFLLILILTLTVWFMTFSSVIVINCDNTPICS